MGARKLYEEEIKKFIETSKDEDLAKIVSIIKTLEQEKKKENDFEIAINEAHGKFAHVKTSSEEFAKRKQEEKMLDRF